MLDRQSKNTIKAVIAVLISVLIGEGIFGLGFFWPFLLILMEWQGIYWFALVVGVIISAIYKMSVGLPSLFLVTVIGAISLLISSRKETGWVILVIALTANFVFDMVFGTGWTIWDGVTVIVAWFIAVRWFEKTETIKISY